MTVVFVVFSYDGSGNALEAIYASEADASARVITLAGLDKNAYYHYYYTPMEVM